MSLLVACSSAEKSDLDLMSSSVDRPKDLNISTSKNIEEQPLGSYKDLAEAVKAGNGVKVEKLARGYLSRNEKDTKALNALGVYYFTQEKYGLAKLIFKKILQDKRLASVHYNLGLIYLVEGDEESAIEELSAALSLDSSHVLASAQMGAIHLKYKNYQRALELLEFAYNAKKHHLALTNNYAIVLRAMGDFNRARNVYESIKGKEKNARVLLNYALLLGDGLKNVEEAKKIINKIKFLTTSPDIMKATNSLLRRLERGSAG